MARKQRRSQFRRNLHGIFLVAFGKMFWSSEDRVRARFHYAESRQNKPQVNLWRKSLIKIWPMARNNISFRMDENKIFNKNPN